MYRVAHAGCSIHGGLSCWQDDQQVVTFCADEGGTMSVQDRQAQLAHADNDRRYVDDAVLSDARCETRHVRDEHCRIIILEHILCGRKKGGLVMPWQSQPK